MYLIYDNISSKTLNIIYINNIKKEKEKRKFKIKILITEVNMRSSN